MNSIPPPSAATATITDSAPIPLDDIGSYNDKQDEHGISSALWGSAVEVASPTSPNRKEAHRLNKKAETSKRKRNRYSFDLGVDNNGEGLPALPSIIESLSRESSRPPSRRLLAQEYNTMSSGGTRRGSTESTIAAQHTQHSTRRAQSGPVEFNEDRSWMSGMGNTEETSSGSGMPHFVCGGEGSRSIPPITSLADSRNLLPLSVSARSSVESSPAISRYASPAVGYSSNASYHDSLGGSGILDPESDGVRSHGMGRATIGVTTDTTGSDFDTDEDEVHTSKPLSARTLWPQKSTSEHHAGNRNSTSQWPWRTRRRTVDLLRDDQPADHRQGHARNSSNEYSPLKREESEGSLAGRLDRDTPSNSLTHSSSSYGNPMAGSRHSAHSQYTDYQSLPTAVDDLSLPKTHLDSASAAFSSELGKHRRGLKQFLSWIKRRVGTGASGVVELANEASQRVAGTTGGNVRLPSGSIGARRRNRRRQNAKGRTDDTLWLLNVLRLVPTQPMTILLALISFGAFAVTLTISLKYLLNPDKAPLPWRDYCQSPHPSYYALQYPPNHQPTPEEHQTRLSMEENLLTMPGASADLLQVINSTHSAWPFRNQKDLPYSAESPDVDLLKPVGVFIGVFTMDEGRDRRMLIRQTYGIHPKSRVPGTEGVRIKFVMGKPRAGYERSVELEMETFDDIMILDIPENMNSGKTHAFFSWAADHAMVPDWRYPSPESETLDVLENPSADAHLRRNRLQRRSRGQSQNILPNDHHKQAATGALSAEGKSIDTVAPSPRLKAWSTPVYQGERRPDYIVKADEDSFIVLGELERRLRVSPRRLTYYGYLVKDLFMAGECYALSYDLAYFVGKAETFKTMTRGAEDKLVARWLRMHPRREEISWVSERCWIYDHPKAGTVYSHGYLFPSTVNTIRHENISELPVRELALRGGKAWASSYSSVSKFGARYSPPASDLTVAQEVEALIEGSEMSLLMRRPDTSSTDRSKKPGPVDRHIVEDVYAHRPTRSQRFLNDPAERGGTAIVHYIKRQEWFMETALALLGSLPAADKVTEHADTLTPKPKEKDGV